MWLFFLGFVRRIFASAFSSNPRGGIGSHAQSILRSRVYSPSGRRSPRPNLLDARTWQRPITSLPQRRARRRDGFRGG
jgi:hypothetical protein